MPSERGSPEASPEVLGPEERTIALCGPCRHFEESFSGEHHCKAGMPLMDGVERTTCAKFHPFPLGEGGVFELSDCCAGGHEH